MAYLGRVGVDGPVDVVGAARLRHYVAFHHIPGAAAESRQEMKQRPQPGNSLMVWHAKFKSKSVEIMKA